MLLKSRDGIRCDLCGTAYRNIFTYYSASGTGLKINKKIVHKTGRALNFDMCQSCYQECRDKVLSHILDAKAGQIKDDYSDNFYDVTEYMKIILTEVVVDSKNGGVVKQSEDIDLILADNSLKDLIKTITETKIKYSKEEDEWTAET